jgi:hypothetical protein
MTIENQMQRLKELSKPIEPGTPKVTISQSIGFTVNLQAYESARIDTSISIEGALENIDNIKEEVYAQLEEAITKQIKDLVAQVDPNKTLLGHRK